MKKPIHIQIQECYNQGDIFLGIDIAQKFVKSQLSENCQLELFLLAKGFYAIRQYENSLYYLNLTKADPIANEELREKLNNKINGKF